MAAQCGGGCIRPVRHPGSCLTAEQGWEIADSIGEDGLTGHTTPREKIAELRAQAAEIREGIRKVRERLDAEQFKDGTTPCWTCGATWQPGEDELDGSWFLQHRFDCEYMAKADAEAKE